MHESLYKYASASRVVNRLKELVIGEKLVNPTNRGHVGSALGAGAGALLGHHAGPTVDGAVRAGRKARQFGYSWKDTVKSALKGAGHVRHLVESGGMTASLLEKERARLAKGKSIGAIAGAGVGAAAGHGLGRLSGVMARARQEAKFRRRATIGGAGAAGLTGAAGLAAVLRSKKKESGLNKAVLEKAQAALTEYVGEKGAKRTLQGGGRFVNLGGHFDWLAHNTAGLSQSQADRVMAHLNGRAAAFKMSKKKGPWEPSYHYGKAEDHQRIGAQLRDRARALEGQPTKQPLKSWDQERVNYLKAQGKDG